LEEAAKNPQDANAADDDTEWEEAPSSSTSMRKVGGKLKREDDDGTEWEEAPARGTFSNSITLKFGSLKYKSRIHTCIMTTNCCIHV
jgi:hypothetical protein